MDKAQEISTELLQLCQNKQLPLLSNILQFLVRFKYQENPCLLFCSFQRLSTMLLNELIFYLMHQKVVHHLYSTDYLLNLDQFIG
jgi:hypothetical protein